jgi:hypothetical protein
MRSNIYWDYLNMENKSCLPYRISTESGEQLLWYVENSIYEPKANWPLFTDQYGQKLD